MPEMPAPTMMTSKRSLVGVSVEPMVPLMIPVSCLVVCGIYIPRDTQRYSEHARWRLISVYDQSLSWALCQLCWCTSIAHVSLDAEV